MMKLKKIIAALAAAAIIAPLPAHADADTDTFYLCAYYGEDGNLVDAVGISDAAGDDEMKSRLDAYAPSSAAAARLFRWNTNLAPVEVPLESDYLSGADTQGDTKDGTVKAPNVISEMCVPSYWISKRADADRIIMSENEINTLNRKILDTPDTNTNDLAAQSETYNGRYMADLNADFESPTGLYLNGEPVPESYYQAIRDNIKNASVSENMKLKYGFAVNRTVMKAYPYEDYLSDDPSDPEWDNLVSSAILVNEPLVIYFTTADGKFSLVKSACCSGWTPTEDIAVCADKTEWQAAIDPVRVLVITDQKVYLEPSADADLNEKLLTMGTALELVTDCSDAVAHRLPWNNYVVKMPARNEDGSFYQKLAAIPANRGVSIGYLPYTEANVITQAFRSLGNRYGWGGMMNSQDCSSFVREVYKCFGFELPRNTTWQSAIPAEVTEMSAMTVQQKKELLDTLPPGAILIFPGHEMLYIGKDNGLYYTVNDVSSLVSPADPSGGIIRPRSVILNDLSTLRANGTTWLDNLSHAVVIK